MTHTLRTWENSPSTLLANLERKENEIRRAERISAFQAFQMLVLLTLFFAVVVYGLGFTQ